VDLDGLAEVSLPGSLSRLDTSGRSRNLGPKQRLLGDHCPVPEDSNFWALSHAFVFERADPKAYVLISRVASQQSFVSGQVYIDWAARVFPFPARKNLAWKQTKLPQNVLLFEAPVDSTPDRETKAWVLLDGNALLQTAIYGDRRVVEDEAALKVLNEIRRTYRLKQLLEDYFAGLRSALAERAAQRRASYTKLLQALEHEELDYAPTPKLVYFNRNLACQFWWRPFDNSGVPWEFAIVARLGIVALASTEERWAALAQENPALDFFGMAPIGQGVWLPYRFEKPKFTMPLRRSSEMLMDTGWLEEGGPSYAFAGVDFAFDSAIPDLSEWLDNVEKLTKDAENRALLEAPKETARSTYSTRSR
jgi:hypothetical protein